jgi:putative membrane protein
VRVREHLANERTYLAWTRTGIAIMGFGVVIARLRYIFPSNALTPPARGVIHAANIGLIFTVIGVFTVVLSAWRFYVVQEQIRNQRYRASLGLVVAFSTVIVVLGLVIIWYLLQSTVGSR